MTHKLKVATPSTSASPYLTYILNSISTYLSAISTSIPISLISVALFHISSLMCSIKRADGICIPHLSHLGSGSAPSCIIVTFSFQCQYMKFSIITPGLFTLSGHPYMGHATNFGTRGKYTMYVSGHLPQIFTPCIYQDYFVCSLRVVTDILLHNLPPALLSTYPRFLPLPKFVPLSHHSPLVRQCLLLAPNETRGAHHFFFPSKIIYQSHPIKHPYHLFHFHLGPYGVAPRYAAVVRIENDFLFTRRPSKPVVCLLSPEDFHQNRPYH